MTPEGSDVCAALIFSLEESHSDMIPEYEGNTLKRL
jgi:hypothetical protein